MSGAGPIEGHCLCGAVKVTLTDPHDQVEICHCDMCRRWTGAFYVAMTGANEQVEHDDSITTFKSSEWAERAFCKQCGSSLWYRFLPTGNRSFLAGLFDKADQLTIEKEIFVDERAAWSDLSGDHPRQTAQEVFAEAKDAEPGLVRYVL